MGEYGLQASAASSGLMSSPSSLHSLVLGHLSRTSGEHHRSHSDIYDLREVVEEPVTNKGACLLQLKPSAAAGQRVSTSAEESQSRSSSGSLQPAHQSTDLSIFHLLD